jgi:hypothetical protein
MSEGCWCASRATAGGAATEALQPTGALRRGAGPWQLHRRPRHVDAWRRAGAPEEGGCGGARAGLMRRCCSGPARSRTLPTPMFLRVIRVYSPCLFSSLLSASVFRAYSSESWEDAPAAGLRVKAASSSRSRDQSQARDGARPSCMSRKCGQPLPTPAASVTVRWKDRLTRLAAVFFLTAAGAAEAVAAAAAFASPHRGTGRDAAPNVLSAYAVYGPAPGRGDVTGGYGPFLVWPTDCAGPAWQAQLACLGRASL